MQIYKISQNQQYLTSIGLEPDVANALVRFFPTIDDKKTRNFLLRRIKRNPETVNGASEQIIANPQSIISLFKAQDLMLKKIMQEANVDEKTASSALKISKKYSTWIAKQLASGTLVFPEDEQKTKDLLQRFDQAKESSEFPEMYRDINVFKSFGELFTKMESYRGYKSKGQKKRDEIHEGVEIVLDEDGVEIRKITNVFAAMSEAHDTGWCTSEPSYAKQYISDGPLYVVRIDGKKVAQIHPESKQIKDISDSTLTNYSIIKRIIPYLEELNIVSRNRNFTPHGDFETIYGIIESAKALNYRLKNDKTGEVTKNFSFELQSKPDNYALLDEAMRKKPEFFNSALYGYKKQLKQTYTDLYLNDIPEEFQEAISDDFIRLELIPVVETHIKSLIADGYLSSVLFTFSSNKIEGNLNERTIPMIDTFIMKSLSEFLNQLVIDSPGKLQDLPPVFYRMLRKQTINRLTEHYVSKLSQGEGLDDPIPIPLLRKDVVQEAIVEGWGKRIDRELTYLAHLPEDVAGRMPSDVLLGLTNNARNQLISELETTTTPDRLMEKFSVQIDENDESLSNPYLALDDPEISRAYLFAWVNIIEDNPSRIKEISNSPVLIYGKPIVDVVNRILKVRNGEQLTYYNRKEELLKQLEIQKSVTYWQDKIMNLKEEFSGPQGDEWREYFEKNAPPYVLNRMEIKEIMYGEPEFDIETTSKTRSNWYKRAVGAANRKVNWYGKQEIVKLASRELLYHGTSIDRLQSILSQGLIPDPKRRTWAEDPDASSRTISRQSFPGIYLTGNFMTAKSSATTAGNPRSGVIVVVQAETRTLATDEDNLVYSLQYSLNHIHEDMVMNEWLMTQTFISYKLGKLEGHFRASAADLLNFLMKKVPEPRKTKVREASIDLFSDILKALLVRTMSYMMKEYGDRWEKTKLRYQLEENGLSFDDIPSAEESESSLRYLIEQATRKLSVIAEDIEDINYTARSITPITFRGVNKIVCVMSYSMPQNILEAPTVLNFHYVSDPGSAARLLEDFQRHITSNVKMKGLEKK